MTTAMANDSAMAMVAQKINSRAMSNNGSPNWLKGVKNSQNRKTMKNTIPAKRKALLKIPAGQAVDTER